MTLRMNYRMLSLSAIAGALLVVSATAFAAEGTEAMLDGKLVSITFDTLVMTGKDGREQSHTFTADTKLTLDGKACKVADLKPGTRIRVTTQGKENSVVTRIQGLDNNPEFASVRHDGKVVSISGNKLIMTDLQGNNERTCILNADTKFTLDGKDCGPSDLKPGMRIRVTAATDEPFSADRIEALDKNLGFASP